MKWSLSFSVWQEKWDFFLIPYTTIWEWWSSKTQWLFFFLFNSMTSWLFFFFFKPWQALLEFRWACLAHKMRIITVLSVPSFGFIVKIERSTLRFCRQPLWTTMDYYCHPWSAHPIPKLKALVLCPSPECVDSQHYSITQSALLCRNWFPFSFLESNKWFLLIRSSHASVFLWTLKSLIITSLWTVPLIYSHCINKSMVFTLFSFPRVWVGEFCKRIASIFNVFLILKCPLFFVLLKKKKRFIEIYLYVINSPFKGYS